MCMFVLLLDPLSTTHSKGEQHTVIIKYSLLEDNSFVHFTVSILHCRMQWCCLNYLFIYVHGGVF